METTTVTITKHRANLAGGIRASMEPAVYGAVLVLDDSLRRLSLSLTPEQVADMATWVEERYYSADGERRPRPTRRLLSNLSWFIHDARWTLWGENSAIAPALTYMDTTDLAALRALAAAVQAETEIAELAREEQP